MTFIDSRGKVFGHLNRMAAWQEGQKPAPVTVEWDLSNRCPLSCPGCHFAHLRTRGPWTDKLPSSQEPCGDLADERTVRGGLKEMAMAGVQGVVWSGGGEPTTHPRWRDIVSYAASQGLRQGMYTSGALLSADDAQHLASTVEWVVVSLDAADAECYHRDKGMGRDTFDEVCTAIQRMSAVGRAVVGVSFMLRWDNWTHTTAMLALSRRLGATYTTFRPAILTDPAIPSVCLDDRAWITNALPDLITLATQPDVECDWRRFQDYRDWTGRNYDACYGIRFSTVVTPDGRLWVCCQRRGEADSCVGNLATESFGEMWRRHPGVWTDFTQCRVMCRLHLTNQTLATVYARRPHGAFL